MPIHGIGKKIIQMDTGNSEEIRDKSEAGNYTCGVVKVAERSAREI